MACPAQRGDNGNSSGSGSESESVFEDVTLASSIPKTDSDPDSDPDPEQLSHFVAKSVDGSQERQSSWVYLQLIRNVRRNNVFVFRDQFVPVARQLDFLCHEIILNAADTSQRRHPRAWPARYQDHQARRIDGPRGL